MTNKKDANPDADEVRRLMEDGKTKQATPPPPPGPTPAELEALAQAGAEEEARQKAEAEAKSEADQLEAWAKEEAALAAEAAAAAEADAKAKAKAEADAKAKAKAHHEAEMRRLAAELVCDYCGEDMTTPMDRWFKQRGRDLVAMDERNKIRCTVCQAGDNPGPRYTATRKPSKKRVA